MRNLKNEQRRKKKYQNASHIGEQYCYLKEKSSVMKENTHQ